MIFNLTFMALKHSAFVTSLTLVFLSLIGASCAVNLNSSQSATNSDEKSAVSNAPVVQEPAPSKSPAVLNLSGRGLTKFPAYIVDRPGLEELDLSHNNMSGAMPAEVRHLTNLRKLNISFNQFTGLPAELGQLRNLEELDVSNNRLTGLPYELGNLSHLRRFVLTGNNYSEQDLAIILKTLPNVEVVR